MHAARDVAHDAFVLPAELGTTGERAALVGHDAVGGEELHQPVDVVTVEGVGVSRNEVAYRRLRAQDGKRNVGRLRLAQ
jgi:hypothetical protein